MIVAENSKIFIHDWEIKCLFLCYKSIRFFRYTLIVFFVKNAYADYQTVMLYKPRKIVYPYCIFLIYNFDRMNIRLVKRKDIPGCEQGTACPGTVGSSGGRRGSLCTESQYLCRNNLSVSYLSVLCSLWYGIF